MEPDHCPERYPATVRIKALYVALMLVMAAMITWSLL